MTTYNVVGAKSLYGEIMVQGSKNAVLPILAATILHKGKTEINNCPKISDVENTISILESIGAKTEWYNKTLIVDASQINSCEISEENFKKMRSSIMFLGSLIGRKKGAIMGLPGGCMIGERPIDMHLSALRKMGTEIREDNEQIFCTVDSLIGADITLKMPSVGATENIILAAVLAKGNTVINNAAVEPEVIALANFLNDMGANVEFANETKIIIKGVDSLQDAKFEIPADRIVAGTYMAAIAGVGGELFMPNIKSSEMKAVNEICEQIGCELSHNSRGLTISRNANNKIKSVSRIETAPYPGFPTDLQSVFTTVMCKGDGTSFIFENIFEDRFKVVQELKKMGAEVKIIDKQVIEVNGVKNLNGSKVISKDLRGGAALIVAGLMANGNTIIRDNDFITRGYEDIGKDFRQIGADVS